ncbi:AAA family ATPase [Dysgonomonas gadei]|uniref:AAA+ ATPase domain-containing protein n=1 Tax=Dysgonomonas gadei ATCC BAA-286 TaxID=742766 RepID=F5J2C0_9BACT|nr:AAA family ATPase [Dysgonomonas gadei]EGK00155.1 hypothetical protein HMPREF9455_03487 [Dysgonomonas gadei ATCC BAA-286]
MLNVNIVHNEVYSLLMKHRTNNPNFFFTLRRSNRDGKLDKGYWFYGNEWYLAVSFWSGTDWKNKTPNISFVVSLDSGQTSLEINTSDSDIKRAFITAYLVDRLELKADGRRYKKLYKGGHLESLESFLKTDKIIIDNIIDGYSLSFFEKSDKGIYFIKPTDFMEQLEKIGKYKNEYIRGNNKPIKLNSVKIENYGPIRKIEIQDIPFSSQWIFLTGENGTGKTSILRAITASICNRKINIDESCYGDFRINLDLFTSSINKNAYNRIQNRISEQINIPLTSGFAGYGQSRLKTNNSGLSGDTLNSISVDDLTSSIFDENSYLMDLQYQFAIWKNDKINIDKYEKRIIYITEILIDILPNLYDINFNDMIGDIPATTYIERDHDGGEFRKVTFNKLASGLKSMIAMIGDILIRLYNQQSDIDDPSEFTGIVLIDEIDIHLHPKLQKQIIQQLTRTFPKIQFIATTHSPIPFLGAPKNSQIFRVERTSEEGVRIKRLDEKIELGDLLPNTILTSPIFGLDDIIPESHDQKSFVRTETIYEQIEFNDKLKIIIDNFITDAKEQELINLFKSRRK